MADELAAFSQKLKGVLAEVLATVGEREVEAIKEAIDIPIEYTPSGAVRSSANEPPRRGVKSHPLQDSIKSAVSISENAVVLTIAAGPAIDAKTGEEYAAKVELGGFSALYKTDQAPRPYMRPSMERFDESYGGAIAEEAGKTR